MNAPPTPGVGANIMKMLGTPQIRPPAMGLIPQDTASRIAQLQVNNINNRKRFVFVFRLSIMI